MQLKTLITGCITGITVFATSAFARPVVCTDKAFTGTTYTFENDFVVENHSSGLMRLYRCVQKSLEVQCRADKNPQFPGAYATITLLRDRNMVLVAWGNLDLDNHVLTYADVSCDGS
ncbi:hypothetical protein [Ruegeria arenilitoris]|uniref:hypothetical protein n=1 Tax=Ruegeria arenilitoris TaxID=1173585 RepID=UPI00147E9FC4|nr:hypothetical protein [Ruegeria arenilitoris]